jgi:nitrile hydratase accessory protein
LNEPRSTKSGCLADVPRLPRDEGGPVFAEPWQAQAFALAVTLSEQKHFTWKEWTAALGEELQAAARHGEPDDGSRYYEHWLTALERLVTAKQLATPTALLTRKAAWVEAYQNTPHGKPVELGDAARRPDRRWLVLGVAFILATYWTIQYSGASAPQAGAAWSAALGSLLGMRHALEPDHLVAVSTLMTGERTSAQAARLGAYWGLGHTLTLLLTGTILVVLRAEMPSFAAEAFELAVVVLLIGFGVRAIYQGAWGQVTGRTHSHTKPATRSGGPWTIARPFLVGAVHGLAGSGAITALVVATLPSTTTRLSYLALFGIGSTLGMTILSGLLGWHIAQVGAGRSVARSFALAAGCVSTVLGLVWAYPLVHRLL